MVIPAPMEDLHKPHIPLSHPSGQQAVVGKGPGNGSFGTIEFTDMVGFTGDIGKLRNSGLHAVGHFVLGNGGCDLRITNLGVVKLVQ